jgi:hypothetical protein
MLSLETRINGALISLTTILNKKSLGKNNYLYEVKYVAFGKDEYNFNFDIVHNRGDGAEILIHKVYEEIAKVKKKTK